MADITGDLMEKLVVDDRKVVLIDMEAGLENFGRRLERSIDRILMIVDPSFESMALAEKIRSIAEGRDKPHSGNSQQSAFRKNLT